MIFSHNTITHTKCGFEFWAEDDLTVQNIRVESNLITDTGENWANNMQNVWGAIRLGLSGPQTEDFIVRNNTIQRCGSTSGGQTDPDEWEPFLNHPSVLAGGGPFEIHGNAIQDSRSMGLIVTNGFSGRISNNVIQNSNWCGVYLIDCDPFARIYNNTIVHNGDFQTYPNVYIENESGIWRNNILYSDVSGLLSVTGGDLDYNCYYPASGPGSHSITADPLLSDIGSGDFTLQPGSPCIDAGEDVGLPYSGDAPDIGAFESGPSSGIRSSACQTVQSVILFGNYPNPFNPLTSISFQIPFESDVRLSIYNAIGQQIRVLVDGRMSAGIHPAAWDGRDRFEREVPSGIYFARLKTAESSIVRKMVLVR